MMATVPYFKVISNKCTVVGICSIRNTFPRALPIDIRVIKNGRQVVLYGSATVPHILPDMPSEKSDS